MTRVIPATLPKGLSVEPERFFGCALHGFRCARCSGELPPKVSAAWFKMAGDVGRIELHATCQHCGHGFTLSGAPRVLA